MAKMGDPGTSPCTCLNAMRTSSSLPTYTTDSKESCLRLASRQAGKQGLLQLQIKQVLCTQ